MLCRRTFYLAVGGLLAGLLFTSVGVGAYEPGDLIVRAGVASVQPDEDSSSLVVNGVAVPGTGAGVDGDEQLGLTATYMLTDHLGLGVLAATPFEHDIQARGLGIDAGSAKHLPPTITVQYFPMAAASALQPYIGLGINYTVFFQEDVASQLENANGASGDQSLDDSFGVAGQAGIDWVLSSNWLLNASVWYLDIDTEATFKFADGTRVEADVDIDPWVYMVGLGYRF